MPQAMVASSQRRCAFALPSAEARTANTMVSELVRRNAVMMVALTMLRDKVLKPVLRNRNLQGPPPRTDNPIDHHYYNLRQEMRRLFRELKIAA